jgi:hypothetical protein
MARWRHPRQWPRMAWTGFTSSLLIVTCPCWCLPIWGWVEYDDYKVRKRNSDKQFQKRRQSYAPDSMPPIRERELSIPLEHPVPVRESQSRLKVKKPTIVTQQTRPQLNSIFLQKLPLEVRLLIYEHCIGGELLHIVREPGRLGYVVCPFWKLDIPLFTSRGLPIRSSSVHALLEWASPDYTSNHMCWHPQDTDGLSYARTRESRLFGGTELFGRRGFLNLLQTCRQVYTEALPVLYQSNTFDLKSLDGLLTLPRQTLHVDLIRSLRLSWTFRADPLSPPQNINQQVNRPVPSTEANPPYDLHTWIQACLFIASMPGLQEVVITIDGDSWVAIDPERSARLLIPLASIKVDRRFEVHVPWDHNTWNDHILELSRLHRNQLQYVASSSAWLDSMTGDKTALIERLGARTQDGRRYALEMWEYLLENDASVKEVKRAIAINLAESWHDDNPIMRSKEEYDAPAEEYAEMTIERREELLDVQKLPVFPARKRRRRNRAFGIH